jgi:hypothetical protein
MPESASAAGSMSVGDRGDGDVATRDRADHPVVLGDREHPEVPVAHLLRRFANRRFRATSFTSRLITSFGRCMAISFSVVVAAPGSTGLVRRRSPLVWARLCALSIQNQKEENDGPS